MKKGCQCGHHHDHEEECCCEGQHGHCECEHKSEAEDYSAINAMFGFDTDIPQDALSLLQAEMDECDELSEMLGLGDNPDVDDILYDAIEELTPKKKKTLMNLAVILHDYMPEEN